MIKPRGERWRFSAWLKYFMGKSKKSNSYIKTNYTGPESLYEAMEADFEKLGLNEDEKNLCKHLYACANERIRQGEFNPYNPIPWHTLRSYVPKANWTDGEGIWLDTVKPHNRKAQRCREFALHSELNNKYEEMSLSMSIDDYIEAKKVNIFTGHKAKSDHMRLEQSGSL